MALMKQAKTLTQALLFGFSLWLSGCGSDGASSLAPPVAFPSPPPPPANQLYVVSGRVELGVPGAGAQVTALALDGTQLAQVQAGPSGCFLFTQPMPVHFRVVARLGAQLFSAEVRNYDGRGRFVHINVPTSMVSLAAANSLELAAAEARVRSILAIPGGTSLESGIEESGRAPFSHFKFFVEAGRAGGPTSLAQQLLNDGRRHVFRLDRATLDGPISNVAAELQPLLLRIRQHPPVRLSLAGTSLLGDGVAKDLKDLIVDGVTSNVRDTITNAIWTWSAERMGLQYGTGPELDAILNGLLEVQGGLAKLDTAILQSEFVAEMRAVNTTTQNLDLLVQANTQAGQALGYVPGTGGSIIPTAPRDPNVGGKIPDFVNSVGSFQAGLDLQTLQRYSLGLNNNSNLITSSFSYETVQIGADRPARFANFPLRSNGILNQFLQAQTYLDGYQSLALHYLGENAHSGLGVVGKIETATANVTRANQLQTQARQQAPALLVSDEILVDLENGLMWYLVAFDETTYAKAHSAASTYSKTINGVTLSHWRIPTKNECISLQQRGRYVKSSLKAKYPNTPVNSNTGEEDTGTSLRGLSALGFLDLDRTKSDGSPVFDQKGSVWYEDYSTPSQGSYNGPWILQANQEFHLNLANDNTNSEDSDKNRPYLICRTLGTQTLLVAGDYGSVTQGPVYPTSPIPSDWTMDEIQDGEFPSLGVPTALGTASATAGNLTLPISYRVNLGGTFQNTQGPNDAGARSNTTPAYNYDRNVTASVPSSPPSFSANNANFVIRNTPDESGQFFLKNSGATNSTVTATITAEHIGGLNPATNFYPVTLSSSTSLTQAAPPRKLTSLLLLPGNRLYTFPNQTSDSDLFQVLAFYDDKSVLDVSTACTLTIVDNATSLNVTEGAKFVNANPYQQLNLVLSQLRTQNLSTLNVTATFGGLSTSTILGLSYPSI